MGIKREIAPPHVGEIITNCCLPENIELTEAAEKLGVTELVLANLLEGESNMSPDLAIRLEIAFGINMEILMQAQLNYQVFLARKSERDIRREIGLEA